MDIKLKTCKNCNEEKPLLENFYKAGRGYQSFCKPCHNKSRMNTYKPKPTAFAKLPEETKKGIIEDVENGLKYTVIAKKYDIKYFNLINWKKKCLIKL